MPASWGRPRYPLAPCARSARPVCDSPETLRRWWRDGRARSSSSSSRSRSGGWRRSSSRSGPVATSGPISARTTSCFSRIRSISDTSSAGRRSRRSSSAGCCNSRAARSQNRRCHCSSRARSSPGSSRRDGSAGRPRCSPPLRCSCIRGTRSCFTSSRRTPCSRPRSQAGPCSWCACCRRRARAPSLSSAQVWGSSSSFGPETRCCSSPCSCRCSSARPGGCAWPRPSPSSSLQLR